MVLNDDYDFSQAPEKIRNAFTGMPEKVRLEAGLQMYRFANGPLSLQRPVGEWWLPVETVHLPSGVVMDSMRVCATFARRLHQTLSSYMRTRAAISERFENSMTELLVVALNVPAWGFVGKASGQPEFKEPDGSEKDRPDYHDKLWASRNVLLIGGVYQMWIPRLQYWDVRQLPAPFRVP